MEYDRMGWDGNHGMERRVMHTPLGVGAEYKNRVPFFFSSSLLAAGDLPSLQTYIPEHSIADCVFFLLLPLLGEPSLCN
jgi:hypothetical protein